VFRANLVPADGFPYKSAPGAILDSGEYRITMEKALEQGGHAELSARRDAARAQGRLYGIGYTAVVEPSVSNMGYITAVLKPAERKKAGPKNGAQATATISIDPVGSISVHVASVPQGQGHRTVLAQVVADVLGLEPQDIRVVTDVDTNKDAWSIASGNYASRFAPAVAGTTHLAVTRLRDRIARIAAQQLNVKVEDIVFKDGRIGAAGNPENAVSFARIAAASHWAPGTLPGDIDQATRETVFWTPPELTAPNEEDEVNSSLCHGFIFDFCAVEIDRATGDVRLDRYVTMHDCGRILHPAMVAGQVTGGFAHALGAALFEEYAYGEDGSFLTGTFADYLVPTIMEVPEPIILHHETRSPFTPLGAKGVGEGNCMSTPVCIANAVADALGVADIELPLIPSRIAEHLHPSETPPKNAPAPSARKPGARQLFGEGSAKVRAPRQAIWDMLLDPKTLEKVVPGAHGIERVSDTHFRADVTLGVGPVKGRYKAEIRLADLMPPQSLTLFGEASGALGYGGGTGFVTLEETNGTTTIHYRYEAGIGGKVASIGGRLLDGAARFLIAQFFAALARRTTGDVTTSDGGGFFARLLARLRGRA
jgi:2-furoyl-CoA dehydrogenase large subunit